METLSESAATFIANALWQISVLLMIAVVCARLILRTPSARRQYLFWVAVFILSVGLPAFSLCSFRDNSKFVVRIPFENNRANIEKTGSIFDTTENAFSIQSNQRIGAFDISIVLSIVSICYFSFLAYRLFYLLKIWRRTALLRHSIKNEKLPSMMDAVAERCCVALEMDTVPIFFSDKIASPITLGARKPIIILPESFISITSEKTLTAVLGHELAHIRRRDYGWNLFYEFVSLPVSFHPAVTIMKRNINQTREMACDELVAESLLKPLDYAGSLVQIAGFITPSSHDAYTLGVFSADILEKRIMKLIETSRGANQRLGKIRFLFVVTLLGITAMATSVFSLALPVKQTSLALPVKQTQDEKSITVSAGILNNKVVNLVKPIYPAAAKAVNASGTVNVEIVIDEKGNVISAEAVSGHPLLKITSVNAARESQFAPTLLEGKPVKVTGVLSYSFSSATDEPTETNVDSDNIKGGAEEGEINPLRILSKPIPQYTEQARKNGISGSVKLRVTFLASGSIGDISPVNSLPDGLTEIAIEAAKGIKFEPATKNGERLTVTRLLEYSFTNF